MRIMTYDNDFSEIKAYANFRAFGFFSRIEPLERKIMRLGRLINELPSTV